jgi:hypothetical protein
MYIATSIDYHPIFILQSADGYLLEEVEDLSSIHHVRDYGIKRGGEISAM